MKKFTLTLVACLMLTCFFTSCEKTEDVSPINPTKVEEQTDLTAQESPKGFQLDATEKIGFDHELMQNFRASEDFKSLDPAALNWEEINLATYLETDMSALIIPFNTTATYKFLYATYLDNEFKTVILEIASSQSAVSSDTPFSGNVNMYTVDGIKLVGATYLNNQFVAVQEFEIGRGYWQCVSWCIGNIFPQLPWWLKAICTTGFGACVYAAQPYACAVLAGCLGGYVAGCMAGCY